MKVGIVGASGYTGLELVRILAGHPKVEISSLTSERFAGLAIDEVFPSLKGFIDLRLSELSVQGIAQEADFLFTALPHGTSMGVVEEFIKKGKRVVDLSADFRLRDQGLYERWYGKHSCPYLLQEAVYGLPEIYREEIKGGRLVANPGCYPTGAILALAPLLEKGAISTSGIVVDAKSGVSGAGRKPSLTNLFCEVGEGLKAYSVTKHRHTPEMEQEISLRAGGAVNILFVPHLIPINRGILSTIYARVKEGLSTEKVCDLYSRRYQNEPFIRLCPPATFPSTVGVRGSNYCDLGVMVDEDSGQLIVISAIDNLVKGASGQAVQNMNIMCGFPETMGLEQIPIFP
ncbi:MAG: N-acetyl-gamma-glutamyl-phosphate reductase [Deltaproteobacteria bacterium]|nr:N-acetyl-gamma-glutamyl-phosphate reductase [Deltaproteobacteria bacterium]